MSALLAALLAAQLAAGQPQTAPCKKLRESSVVKLNFKPDTEVADLITWFSRATCTTVLVSNSVSLSGKKVTIIAPTPITLAEARRLFYAALDSVGLTAEQSGKIMHVLAVRPKR